MSRRVVSMTSIKYFSFVALKREANDWHRLHFGLSPRSNSYATRPRQRALSHVRCRINLGRLFLRIIYTPVRVLRCVHKRVFRFLKGTQQNGIIRSVCNFIESFKSRLRPNIIKACFFARPRRTTRRISLTFDRLVTHNPTSRR